MTRVFLNDFAVMSRLGMNRTETLASLTSSSPPRPDERFDLVGGGTTMIARLPGQLPDTSSARTRTNRIASHLLGQMKTKLGWMKATFGAERIAVIVGTSTTGIEESLVSLGERMDADEWPEDFQLEDQELGDLAHHIGAEVGAEGTQYTISTACTSATKAIISAARLVRTGIADAVICGGIDSFSRLTVNGFHALSSVSAGQCSPFGTGRDGINIGEGGALFILSREPSEWEIAGGGESSDAHHMSAPDPTGAQAERAVRDAMDKAGVTPEDVDFVHMHGTGTPLNDEAEAGLVMRVFGADTHAMSTKGMTGHTLGAAGGLQVAINIICMEAGVYPPHVFNGDRDETLAPIRLSRVGETADAPLVTSLCASYAFGGSNAALVLKRVKS
jgi:3-oxoacyl-[acyl-carrier-protein] synthase-1